MLRALNRQLHDLGNAVTRRLVGFFAFIRFFLRTFALLFERRVYHPIVLENIGRQLYFTAFQPLPVFALYTGILSLSLVGIIVSLSSSYGLENYRLSLIAGFLMAELLPFMSALFVALRSGSAINTEMALMVLTRENQALEANGVEVAVFEWLPRLFGVSLSVVVLTLFADMLAALAGYLVLYDWRFGHWQSYLGELAAAFDPVQLVLVVVKAVLFGVWIVLIPIHTGQAAHSLPLVPVMVLKGMMRVFLALLMTEVTLLLLSYL